MFAKTKYDYKYVYYVLKSVQLNKLSFANAQPLITGTLVKNQIAGVQTSSEEQQKIVKKIENGHFNLNQAIAKAQTEIKKIKEYQESLITQVVTGQFKVPELANEQELL